MAEINPPLYLDQDDAYGAAELGLPYRDIMGEGVVGADDLAVTAGTGLKSSVAAGAAWIQGDDNADEQPTYRVRNDAPVLLQHDAADATNPRIDLVIAQVEDAAFSGVSKLWKLAIVKGTPAATPAAPALPTDAIALAEAEIPAGSGTLGTITDARTRARVGGGSALSRDGAAYGTRTADVTTTSLTFAGGAPAVASDLTLDADGVSDYELEISATSWATVGGGTVSLLLSLDGADSGIVAKTTSTAGEPLNARTAILAPAAGKHTVNLVLIRDGSATSGIINAASGGSTHNRPALVTLRRL